MTGVAFFGYGSLVNPDANAHAREIAPGRVRGWRRAWAHPTGAPGRGVTSLTVQPDPDGEIEGVLAFVDDLGDLAALDAREAGYERRYLDAPAVTLAEAGRPTRERFLYVSLSPRTAPADPDHPILRSYVDCVLQGYLRRFGETGLLRFMETTEGWDGFILDDRAAPRYPRHVSLDEAEREIIETALAARRSA